MCLAGVCVCCCMRCVYVVCFEYVCVCVEHGLCIVCICVFVLLCWFVLVSGRVCVCVFCAFACMCLSLRIVMCLL